MSVMASVAVSQVGMTEVILVNPGVKVNGQYYCDVLLSQQMLSAIKLVAERCLFTKQYVAYDEIGHFLCFVISQGKVVALDRWGGKWNHLSMTHRLATNYAKNYCNRTPIAKVIVENVVTCFFGTQCIKVWPTDTSLAYTGGSFNDLFLGFTFYKVNSFYARILLVHLCVLYNFIYRMSLF